MTKHQLAVLRELAQQTQWYSPFYPPIVNLVRVGFAHELSGSGYRRVPFDITAAGRRCLADLDKKEAP